MGINLTYIAGQTSLDEDEQDGLRIKAISTHAELDEFEQQNIEEAVEWTMKHPDLKIPQILSTQFIRDIHKKMFGNVWQWAGLLRTTNKNIGVDKSCINDGLSRLLSDCRYQLEHNIYSPVETVVRFKHRLVSIHPFANGNGRHSRLMADILISSGCGLPVFCWGGISLTGKSSIRTQYIQALRAADNKDYAPLMEFAVRG
jgi:Fic-DOC domain mobile mystery protein B